MVSVLFIIDNIRVKNKEVNAWVKIIFLQFKFKNGIEL